MLLMEVIQLAGYWTFEEKDGVRIWTPVFQTPSKDSLFPFQLTQPMRMDPNRFAVQAFKLPSRKGMTAEEKVLFRGLEDALKLRSTEDVIHPTVFQDLIDTCASTVISKAKLHGQNPKRIVIVTPGSSSPVAERFTRAIQQRLGVDDSHVFMGHYTKRDAAKYHQDIMDNPNISDEDKQRLKSRAKQAPGSKIQAKALQRGKRDLIRKAGVHMHDVTKDFELQHQQIPYLLVVDDNVQTGATYKSAAELFTQNTGVTPGKAIGLAMFKYA